MVEVERRSGREAGLDLLFPPPQATQVLLWAMCSAARCQWDNWDARKRKKSISRSLAAHKTHQRGMQRMQDAFAPLIQPNLSRGLDNSTVPGP